MGFRRIAASVGKQRRARAHHGLCVAEISRRLRCQAHSAVHTLHGCFPGSSYIICKHAIASIVFTMASRAVLRIKLLAIGECMCCCLRLPDVSNHIPLFQIAQAR